MSRTFLSHPPRPHRRFLPHHFTSFISCTTQSTHLHRYFHACVFSWESASQTHHESLSPNPTPEQIESKLKTRFQNREKRIKSLLWRILLDQHWTAHPLPKHELLLHIQNELVQEENIKYTLQFLDKVVQTTQEEQKRHYWDQIEALVTSLTRKRRVYWYEKRHLPSGSEEDSSEQLPDHPTLTSQLFTLRKEEFIEGVQKYIRLKKRLPTRRIDVAHIFNKEQEFQFESNRDLIAHLIRYHFRMQQQWSLVLPAVKQDLLSRFLFHRHQIYENNEPFEHLLDEIKDSMDQRCDIRQARDCLLELEPQDRNLTNLKTLLLRRFSHIPHDNRLRSLLDYSVHDDEIMRLLGSMWPAAVQDHLESQGIHVSLHYIDLIQKLWREQQAGDSRQRTCTMKEARHHALALRPEERSVPRLKTDLLSHYWSIPRDKRLEDLLHYIQFDSKIKELSATYPSAKSIWKELRSQGASVSQHYIALVMNDIRNTKKESSQNASSPTHPELRRRYTMSLGRQALLQIPPEDRNVEALLEKLESLQVFVSRLHSLRTLIQHAQHDNLIVQLLQTMSPRQAVQELHSRGVDVSEKYVLLVNREESRKRAYSAEDAFDTLHGLDPKERTLENLKSVLLSRFGSVRHENRLENLMHFSTHDTLIQEILRKRTPLEAWTLLKSQNIDVPKSYVQLIAKSVENKR